MVKYLNSVDAPGGLVSFSACLIAANRAVETEQADPYIYDPLAAGLCGPEALEARRARDKPIATIAEQPANAEQPELPARRPIPRLIMRTKFFDDVVTVATWRGAGAGAEPSRLSCHTELLEVVRGSGQPCLQVVLLGSGMDSRPWRLPLPPGVRWFEVDRQDVLAAKKAQLQVLGAQTDALQPPDSTAVQARNPGAGEDGLQEDRPAGGWAHPLHVSQWSGCVADLTCRGWSRALVELGLDVASPVLWVLEGLLYYLEEPDVRALLKEAASVSMPGSVLAASVIRGAPDGGERGGEPDAGTGEMRRAARGSGRAGDPGGGLSYSLAKEFKWRCQEEISKFLGDCGWRTLVDLPWLDAAKAYGLPPANTAASSVHFVTAARA